MTIVALLHGIYLLPSSLRDLSQETDQDYRKKISDLEKELAASEEMQCMSCH
jgi:hypothetical protein